MKKRIALVVCVAMVAALVFGPAAVSAPRNGHSAACPFEGKPTGPTVAQDARALLGAGLTAVGDPVDMDAALAAGADYVRHAQADVTEDNALNGNPDVPDDPDDGGWDWRLTSPDFTHSTVASSTNLFGVTAMGLYYAYLETNDASYMTAMQDAATCMLADATIDSAGDLVFLMRFQDLSGVTADIYKVAAKTKFDAKIAGSTPATATGWAEYIRDVRAGQGYENGIIPWDIGAWVVAAQMLEDRYASDSYDYAQAADDMAEVLYQDSYMTSPGYFDLTTNKNNGWDPAYANQDYYWYALGISGLMDAFVSAGVHLDKVPGLVTLLLYCRYPGGAFSYCYGAHVDDEDWQTTAYAVMSLARLDQATYQTEINHACYWLGATQDSPSGGWVYSSSGNHYPEVGGECTSALYFGQNASEVWVDDDYTSSSCGGHLWGYDAFDNIQDGIDAVVGSTVNVAAGMYDEGLIDIDKSLTLQGDASDKPVINPTADTIHANHRGWFQVTGASTVASFKNLKFDGSGQNIENCIRYQEGPTGTVDNCDFSNIGSGGYTGLAVVYLDYAAMGGGATLDLSPDGCVKNCTFTDIERIGVMSFGVDQIYVQGNAYNGKGDGDHLDYGVEVGGGGVATIEQNNVIQGCTGVASSDGSTSAGILVTTYYGAGSQATITGNTLTANTGGIAVGYDASDTSTVVAHFNNISGNTTFGVDTTAPAVDAEYNWWGAASGPGSVGPGSGDGVSTNVDYSPWLGNWPSTPGSNTYVVDPSSDTAGIQAIIDSMSAGDTLHFSAGTYSGGFTISTAGIIITADPGAVIGPGSDGMIIAADGLTVVGLEFDGAGSTGFDDGIQVNTPRKNLVIKGCKIHGWAQDGIHFDGGGGGVVENLQVLDNRIYNNSRYGLRFSTLVSGFSGVQEIFGNEFKNNTGNGINNESGQNITATYNSWGDIGGPLAGGDGVSGDVTYDPWTFLKMWVEPATQSVREGYNATVNVKLDAENLYGAEWALSFDETKLQVVSITEKDFPGAGGQLSYTGIITANTSGKIEFHGYRTTDQLPDEFDGTDVSFLEIVFAAQDIGAHENVALTLSCVFGAKGGINIYADSITDGAIRVWDLGDVTGRVDLQGRADDTGAVVTVGPGAAEAHDPGSDTSDYWGAYGFDDVVTDDYDVTVEMERYLDASRTWTVTNAPNDWGTLVLLGGDANDSDVIDILDLSVIGGQFGNTVDPATTAADINYDGVVNILDLVLAGGNYAKTESPW